MAASWWQKLTKITIPLVRPSLTVSTVLNVIYVFNSFPIIYTITKGAPANKTDTLITYLYMLAFYDQKKGPATALSVIGFLILWRGGGAVHGSFSCGRRIRHNGEAKQEQIAGLFELCAHYAVRSAASAGFL